MTCPIKRLKADYYLPEQDDLDNFKVDQTVVLKEKYLKHIDHLYRKDKKCESSTLDEWYPFVNSYYPFTEDVDAFARVNHLLESKPSFASLSSVECESYEQEKTVYSEKSAEVQYLESNPVSFIILGKPGIGEQELGKQLAEYWQCVYIDPEVLIEQEINSGSRAGACIEFNLRCGRAIGIDVILRLVEKRVKSESAKHRGFVICGLPLIPNDLYEEDPISSESAVFNVREIFEEVFDTVIEVGVPPSKPHVSISSKYKSADEDVEEEEIKEIDEEEVADEAEEVPLPKEVPILKEEPEMPTDIGPDIELCVPPDIGKSYEDQLNFIFEFMKTPFLIIYIMCSSTDVINKRDNYRFDVYSRRTVNLQTENCNKLILNYFSTLQDVDNEEIPEEFFDMNYLDIDSSNLMHLVRLPRHFPANVATQLDAYHYTALNFIERRVLMQDPQYFLKVDGRTNVQRMFHIIKSRLKVLPLQNVLLPAKLNVDEEVAAIGEGAPELFNTEGMTFEECYREFSKRQVASSMFKWRWSDWGTKCPIYMRNGRIMDGDSKFAVRFMSKMYFLADEEAFVKFYRNPRPYLLPPNPRPSCKMFIFGPKCSGKTSLAKCLSYVFDGTVFSISKMMKRFMSKKANEVKEQIRQAAITTAMKILDDSRANDAELLEKERVAKIKAWMAMVLELINDLIKLLYENEKPPETKLEISSFPMAMKRRSLVEDENETTIAISKIRDELDKYRFPYSESIAHWQQMVMNKRLILNYLPAEYKGRVEPKPATVFDKYVVEYAESAVANAVLDSCDVNAKNMMEIFTTSLKAAEESNQEHGTYKGWIIDGMLCDVDFLSELYPDYMASEIVILQDEDDFEFLTTRYTKRGENQFWDFRRFLMDIGKFDAAWRCPSDVSTKSFKNTLARTILSEIFDDVAAISDAEEYDADADAKRKAEVYRQSLIEFKEKWKQTKDFFLEHNIQPLEIKIANKSLPEMMKEVIRNIEDKYRVRASLFTEEDRAEEVKNIGNQIVQRDIGEDTGVVSEEDIFEKNRRYGDTYYYCPVTFYENGVLWKGKEDFATKFKDKIYLLSSEADMNKFLQIPRNYLPGKPPDKFPPPRICVVGVPGTGKTFLSKAIADNFGLTHVSFESLVKTFCDITTTESLDELRRNEATEYTLYQYLNTDEPLPEDVFKIWLHKVWFERPTVGFVLDDFPKRPSDIEFMTKYKLIPDVVIYLTIERNQMSNLLVERCLRQWEEEVSKQRALLDEQNRVMLIEWEENRRKRYDELIEERRERRYAQKKLEKALSPVESLGEHEYLNDLKGNDEDADRSGFRTTSQVSFDSVAELEDIDEVNRILDIECPEVLIEDPFESLDEAREKFEYHISNLINVETEFLQNIKALCISEMILFKEVTADFSYPEMTKRHAFVIVDKFNYRTMSHFERCYDVSMEVAERLLSCGYFFLSKFGKTCPVQYYENKNPVQMYVTMEQKYNIFPVIHRSFIYYTVGRENQAKFKEDPLRFVEVDNFNFPMIPFRVAVTGPPKCGKTILAERIKNEFGFKLITRGQAARYVLCYLPFSNLATNMESVLRKGWELTDEMVVKCVEAASLDGRAVSQGIVFDGFPVTISEVKHLSYVGLVPNLVVDLQATGSEVLECLSNDVGRRGFPRYSKYFIEHIFKEWTKTSTEFRAWFDHEYQVTASIPINTCNWSVWSQAKDFITSVFFEIKHYYVHIAEDWPLRLANMQVTPLEFLERQSSYKSFCPCCLHFSRIMTNGGEPPDRTGLIQFRRHFYWLCPEHIEQFLKMPEAFLPPYNKTALPQQIPKIVHLADIPDNVFEDGACAVCYIQRRVIVKGHIQNAVDYNYKVYLFDTKECLMEFIKNPQKFMCEIEFRPPANYPALRYDELPVLGMLEQYVARPITKALSHVTRRRPIIPGLNITASAAVGIGLHLKNNNRNISDEYKPCYKEADELYEKRRTKLINFLDSMKTFINPYLYYEEPMPEFEMPPSIKSQSTESVTTAMFKLVDEIVNNIDYGEDG